MLNKITGQSKSRPNSFSTARTIQDEWDDMLEGKNAHKSILRHDNFEDDAKYGRGKEKTVTAQPCPKNGARGEDMETEKLTTRQINALAAVSTRMVYQAIEGGRCSPNDILHLVRERYIEAGDREYRLTDKGRDAWRQALGVE